MEQPDLEAELAAIKTALADVDDPRKDITTAALDILSGAIQPQTARRIRRKRLEMARATLEGKAPENIPILLRLDHFMERLYHDERLSPPQESEQAAEEVKQALAFGIQMAARAIEWVREKGLESPTLIARLESYMEEAQGNMDNISGVDNRRAFRANHFIAAATQIIENSTLINDWPEGDHTLVYQYPTFWPMKEGEASDLDENSLDVVINAMTRKLANISMACCDFKHFLAQTEELFAFLYQLQHLEKLAKPFPAFPRRPGADFDRMVATATTGVKVVDVDENTLWFHIMEGVKAILSKQGIAAAAQWDIRNNADREKMRVSLRKEIMALQGVDRALKQQFVQGFTDIFAHVARWWEPPPNKATSEPNPTGSGTEAPPPASPATIEATPPMLADWARLRNFADAHFSLSGRRASIVEKQVTRELEEARGACESNASRLPAPLDADVNLHGKTECDAIEGVHLHRPAGEAVTHLSNLVCDGHVQLRSGKGHYTVNFKMNENGELEIVTTEGPKGKGAFQSQALRTFYLELQKVITMGLSDRLVRVTTGQETLRQADPRESSTLSTKTPTTGEGGSSNGTITPRTLADLLVLGNDGDPIEKGPLIPHGTELLSHLLAQEKPIVADDLHGQRLSLFQQEVIDVEVSGNKERVPLEVFVPIPEEDHVRVVEEMRTGRVDPAHVFLMRHGGGQKRLGYHRWRRKGEPATERFTQCHPTHPELEPALRSHLERRRVGIISEENDADLQFFVLSVDPEIRQVRLRLRRNMEGWEEVLLLTEDLHLMAQGAKFEDGLSDGAALVDEKRGILSEAVTLPGLEGEEPSIGYRVAAVLKVPQTVQYVQGSYTSVKDAIALLKAQAV